MGTEIEFDEEKCIVAKRKIGNNATISRIWRQYFAPSNRIGNMTTLYRKLKPSDPTDFYNKYIDYAQKNRSSSIKNRGLTYNELVKLAEKYREFVEEKMGITYDFETFFYDALCHIILETWDGQQNERDFKAYLKALGYECSEFKGSIDGEYGLDIKVTRNDGKISAIQIKPISFFVSWRDDVQLDRINFCRKYEKALNDLGIKTYYAIYVKDKKTDNVLWVKNGNMFRFRINELFDYDPEDIEGTFTRKKLPKIYERLPI
jgi:hypothetical protein